MLTTETPSQQSPIAFGKFGDRLKQARETQKLTEKDVAIRLHLNTRIISLLENEQFENAPPLVFLRGYLRSYARLLGFDENTIEQALSQLAIVTITQPPSFTNPSTTQKRDYPYIYWATYGIITLLITLVGMWWHMHSVNSTPDKSPVITQTLTPPEAPANISAEPPKASESITPAPAAPVIEPAPASTPPVTAEISNPAVTTKAPKDAANTTTHFSADDMATPEPGFGDDADENQE